jgi:hypothetical protein
MEQAASLHIQMDAVAEVVAGPCYCRTSMFEREQAMLDRQDSKTMQDKTKAAWTGCMAV